MSKVYQKNWKLFMKNDSCWSCLKILFHSEKSRSIYEDKADVLLSTSSKSDTSSFLRNTFSNKMKNNSGFCNSISSTTKTPSNHPSENSSKLELNFNETSSAESTDNDVSILSVLKSVSNMGKRGEASSDVLDGSNSSNISSTSEESNECQRLLVKPNDYAKFNCREFQNIAETYCIDGSTTQEINVNLRKESASERIGLTLCYAFVNGKVQIFVKEIDEGTLAAKCEKILPGDQIKCVNNVRLKSREQAMSLFKSSLSLKLKIVRQIRQNGVKKSPTLQDHKKRDSLTRASSLVLDSQKTKQFIQKICSSPERSKSLQKRTVSLLNREIRNKEYPKIDYTSYSCNSTDRVTDHSNFVAHLMAEKTDALGPALWANCSLFGDYNIEKMHGNYFNDSPCLLDNNVLCHLSTSTLNLISEIRYKPNFQWFHNANKRRLRSRCNVYKFNCTSGFARKRMRNSTISRYRYFRNEVLKAREQRIMEERSFTTDEEWMSEAKLGKYWTKSERKKQLEKARQYRARQRFMQECGIRAIS